MKARKEVERKRKERMVTVPLSILFRHRVSAANGDRGRGGVLDGGFRHKICQGRRRGESFDHRGTKMG